MTVSLPLTGEDLRDYNNIPTTPPENTLGDIINALSYGGFAKYAATGADVDIYVNATTGNDTTGDGESSTTAYATIARALADVPDLVLERIFTIRCVGEFGADGTFFVQRYIRGSAEAATGTRTGAVRIVGEPDTLNNTRTLVSAAAGSETPLVDLDVGTALTSAVVAGKTFVEQSYYGVKYYYPVVSAVGAVVTVVGDASSFTAGESLVIRDVGGTNGAKIHDIYLIIGGFIDFACFDIQSSVVDTSKFYGTPQPDNFYQAQLGGCCFSNSGTIFVVNLSLRGCSFNAATRVISTTCVMQDFNCESTPRFTVDGPQNFFYGAMRYKLTANPKFYVRGSLLIGNGVFRVGGIGTAFLLDSAYALLTLDGCTIDVATGLTQLYDASNGATLVFTSTTHSGTVNGVPVTLGERALCVGLEAAAGTLAATPAGSDVIVGAAGTFTFAALPQTDTTELVRAT